MSTLCNEYVKFGYGSYTSVRILFGVLVMETNTEYKYLIYFNYITFSILGNKIRGKAL